MPNETLKHRLNIGPQKSAVAFLWRHLHLNVTWYPGNSSCDSNLNRILWFFFPLCFQGLDPKKREKLSNPVGGFQEEGLTDILLKLNFKCVFITSPWHEGSLDSMKVLLWSTSCVWKFPSCFHLSPFTFFLPAEQMLSKFFPLERISQVSLSSLWKLRMETPSFCEVHSILGAFPSGPCDSPDSQKLACFSGVEWLGVTDGHAWWLDHLRVCGIRGRLEFHST